MAPEPACRSACIAGMATLTMKKSRTTMKVPARTTGRAAQRLARTAASPVGEAASSFVLMAATMPSARARVDYLGGRRVGPRASARPRVQPGEREIREHVAERDQECPDDRDPHEHREVAVV